ncbi:MAG: STAS-like domain-containing protein [Syntrophaceae bacterium]|nr:STAS-like domain-containing protein [Syntrophaceae bacterium]
MIEINIFSHTGDFAEDKDLARNLRLNKIAPTLKDGQEIILNFENVSLATQSFIHALISELIRSNGIEVLDKISFKSCNNSVKAIINVVVDYMQDVVFESDDDTTT